MTCPNLNVQSNNGKRKKNMSNETFLKNSSCIYRHARIVSTIHWSSAILLHVILTLRCDQFPIFSYKLREKKHIKTGHAFPFVELEPPTVMSNLDRLLNIENPKHAMDATWTLFTLAFLLSFSDLKRSAVSAEKYKDNEDVSRSIFSKIFIYFRP